MVSVEASKLKFSKPTFSPFFPKRFVTRRVVIFKVIVVVTKLACMVGVFSFGSMCSSGQKRAIEQVVRNNNNNIC